mgnify:FL=1
MKRMMQTGVLMLVFAVSSASAMGQTSSLVLDDAARPQLDRVPDAPQTTQSSLPQSRPQPQPVTPPPARPSEQPTRLSPAIAQSSVTAVTKPEPRQFAKHDLVTIIIRESVTNDSSAKIKTEKDSQIEGKIEAFPKLQLSDLLQFQLGQSKMSRGIPEVSIEMNNEFEGEGENKRVDSFTARVQAEIIDIKPNGNLVLEARRYIQTDNETLTMTLTGTCRAEDIQADNTVLSTVVADLRLIKEHTGELRRATKKGLLTKFFETIFNF